MRLTEQDIRNYQNIYFKCFDKKISKDEAGKQALKLLLLVKLVLDKAENE